MRTLSTASQAFINACTTLDSDEQWFSSLKKCALESFSQQGLPTVRNEAWKYTSLKHLDHIEWSEVTDDHDAGELTWLVEGDTHRLVFVNGRFNNSLSTVGDLPDGAFIGSLAEALVSESDLLETYLGKIANCKDSPLIALNAAHMEDGFVILLRNVQLTKSIEIIHVGRPNGLSIAYHPRNLVVVDHQSKMNLIEQFTGANAGAYFANSVIEIIVEGGSQLEHHRVFSDGAEALSLASTSVKVGKSSSYTSLVLSKGGQLLRNDLHIMLDAAGAQTKLGGVYMATGDQHVDHTTVIEHLKAHTTSDQVFKGALNGMARGVFQGNIIVHKGADGADGQLSNKTLLLSPGTEIDSKPQLEIYADDVKCAHGSTAGELDEEALFYLRSRGIPEIQAKAMLVNGFLSEVTEEFDTGKLANTFQEHIANWMGVE